MHLPVGWRLWGRISSLWVLMSHSAQLLVIMNISNAMAQLARAGVSRTMARRSRSHASVSKRQIAQMLNLACIMTKNEVGTFCLSRNLAKAEMLTNVCRSDCVTILWFISTLKSCYMPWNLIRWINRTQRDCATSCVADDLVCYSCEGSSDDDDNNCMKPEMESTPLSLCEGNCYVSIPCREGSCCLPGQRRTEHWCWCSRHNQPVRNKTFDHVICCFNITASHKKLYYNFLPSTN